MGPECEFANIYSDYYEKIVQYLSRTIGPKEAEDAAQDVLNKVYMNLSGFKEKSKLSTWIYRIATNTAIDRLRSSAHKHSENHTSFDEATGLSGENGFSESRQPAIDQSLIHKEMGGCIREFIDNLPPNYRTAITMSDIEGMSNQEVADALGISLDNVKIRLHRARTKLREALESGCDFYHDEKDKLACDRKQTQILPKIPE